MALISAAVTAGLAVWLVVGLGGTRTTLVVDDVTETIAPLAAVAACWWAARHRQRTERLSWVLLGAACLSWGLGQGVWTYLEVIRHAQPFPSLADPLYLAFVPLSASALLAFLGGTPGVWWRVRLGLDGLIACSTALFVSWALLLGPVVRTSPNGILEKILTIAYPAGDVILVAMVLIVASRVRSVRAISLIAAGLLSFVAADSAFGYTSLAGSSSTTIFDAAWVAGFLLIGLAASIPAPATEVSRARPIRWYVTLLPCAPVPAAIAIVVVRVMNGGHVEPFLAWLGIATSVLILARQMVALLELARGLEVKVEDRTEELRRSDDRFRSLLQHSSDGVLVLDRDLRITYATDPVERLFGRRPEDLTGAVVADLMGPLDREALQTLLNATLAEPWATSTQEFLMRRGDGTLMHCQTVAANLLDDVNVGGLMLTIHDISDRRALEDHLRELAFHDPLTGLPNRALFRDRVGHALVVARRKHEACAVLFVDLDDFKRVNDSLGHGAGDELLRTISDRIQATLRTGDTVARLGGDEFAILAEGLTAAEDAVVLADRVLIALRDAVEIEGRSILPQASIGIVTCTRTDTVDELLRNADVAMYEAKSRGKGTYEVFKPAMHAAAIRRLEMEEELRRAIDRDQFVVHYQPIIRLGDGSIAGVEALIRWKHPDKGLVLPVDFIPLAEDTGLIVPIGNWMLARACRDVAELQRLRGGDPLCLAVNLSSRQLGEASIRERVGRAIAESGINPSTLMLEITETVLMADTADTIERMQALRAMGLSFAMDDFGTGYSSLSYLRRYPIQMLKIDRSFIAALGDEEEDTALVQAILSLAQTLGIQVVAEGIEDAGQAELLKGLGCVLGQGYYFGRPMALDALVPALSVNAGQGGSLVLSPLGPGRVNGNGNGNAARPTLTERGRRRS